MIKFMSIGMLVIAALVMINEQATGDFWESVEDAGFKTVKYDEMLDK